MLKKSAVIKIGTIAAALFVLVWNFPAVAELYPALQEPPIILQASDILPKDLRVGPGFRLEETVKNDGLINTYQLKSLYGAMTLESTAMLRIRINRIKGTSPHKHAIAGGLYLPEYGTPGILPAAPITASMISSYCRGASPMILIRSTLWTEQQIYP